MPAVERQQSRNRGDNCQSDSCQSSDFQPQFSRDAASDHLERVESILDRACGRGGSRVSDAVHWDLIGILDPDGTASEDIDLRDRHTLAVELLLSSPARLDMLDMAIDAAAGALDGASVDDDLVDEDDLDDDDDTVTYEPPAPASGIVDPTAPYPREVA